MAIVLRPYQERAVGEVRAAFLANHQAVLFQLATGGGKTLTAGHILSSAAAKNNPGMFICNRVELLEQSAKAFDRLGMEYGLVAAGFSPNPRAMVQIASIDTLKRRVATLRTPPKLIVWDECRGLGAAGWTAVFKAFPNAKHLGLDATPIRLDGRGLGEYFSHMVLGPTYSELMAMGNLVPFECFSTPPDLSGVRTKGNDYDADQTAEVMDKPQLIGNAVQHYLDHGRGKLGITFAVNRRHSEHLAAEYRAAGVAAVHLDGDTDKAERKKVVAAFRRREIQVLTNVNLFSAGFDVPGVEIITDCAPTQSLSMYLQRAGRGSRPDEETPDKTHCVLLDHAGNVYRHGLPDQDREWSLEGRPKGKKKASADAVQVKQCEGCFRPFWPPPTCPYCGKHHEVAARELEQVDGTLAKVDKAAIEAMRLQKKIEVRGARTLDALEEIERARGYKPGWAKWTFEARQGGAQRRVEAQAKAFGGRW